MDKFVTILFAYRDRDLLRIRNSLDSLEKQTNFCFQVILVDYGSRVESSHSLKSLLKNYSFVDYYKIGHEGLLWNKSKAFNFGISRSKTEFVFTADIDLVFAPRTIERLYEIRDSESFFLFSYGYLRKRDCTQLLKEKKFEEFEPSHYGNVNGAGFYPKKALEAIRGYDEFYHFYGSEDEDLFLRLRNLGIREQKESENLLLHQWHKRYPDSNDIKLTHSPRIFNIRRINQQHYFWAKASGRTVVGNKDAWESYYLPEDIEALKMVSKEYRIGNKASAVVHFLNEILPSLEGVVSVQFSLEEPYSTAGFFLRKVIKRNIEPYLSLKEVNDEVLKQLIFKYRHHNYIFKVASDFRAIHLVIDLQNRFGKKT